MGLEYIKTLTLEQGVYLLHELCTIRSIFHMQYKQNTVVFTGKSINHCTVGCYNPPDCGNIINALFWKVTFFYEVK